MTKIDKNQPSGKAVYEKKLSPNPKIVIQHVFMLNQDQSMAYGINNS